MKFETSRDKQHYFSQTDNYCTVHFHRSVEFVYVTKGEKTVFLNGREYRLKQNDLFVTPPYGTHFYIPSRGSEQIVATAMASVCSAFEELCKNSVPESPVYHDETGELLPMITKLKDCKNDFLYSGIVNYVLGVYIENTRFLSKKQQHDRTFGVRLVEYINERYANELSLSQIADAFGYSPSYFSTLFKKTFYVSFVDYLNGVRVQKSLPFLKRFPASKVYSLCGFNSPQQYFLHFKRFYGVSPKEFLKIGF